MAVIDTDAVNKASQDKSQDAKSANSAQNLGSNQSQDNLSSIEEIARQAFNASYDAVNSVIRQSTQAGIEKAIAEHTIGISAFKNSFKTDFLRTIEAKAEPYTIGATVLRLLGASGVDYLQGDRTVLLARFYELDAMQEFTDEQDKEFNALTAHLFPEQDD